MALLVVFPKCPSSFSHLTYSNKGNHVLAVGNVRVPSLRKEDKRCKTRAAPIVNGRIAGAKIVPSKQQTLVKRSDFPNDFKFGASTSALQTEGPADIGGRGPSTWDSMIQQGTETVGESIDVATLSYDKYKEDVQLLKNMGVDVYRFSISWSRILPDGTGDINQEGIDFYNNLINELIANGIQPFVTLFHFDLPTALQDKYNGFLDEKIVEDFKNYCDICFKNFGDRVTGWTTINEPAVFAQYGYQFGLSIPDEPTTYPYLAAHHIILAHAAAARLYKDTYQATQGGEIGIAVSLEWFKPYSELSVDKEAAARAFSFLVGWFLEPLVYGDYPFVMKALVKDRLPSFTDEEKEMVKGAYDFVGANYYTSRYAKALPISANDLPVGYSEDQYVEALVDKDEKPIGNPVLGNANLYVVPEGLRDGLIHLKNNYSNPKIYITENGVSETRNDDLALDKALDDKHRISFVLRHLNAVQEALREGVNVKGYFIWALLDCMEVGSGYTVRFGLNFTDYNNNLERYPKKSAQWLSNFLKKD